MKLKFEYVRSEEPIIHLHGCEELQDVASLSRDRCCFFKHGASYNFHDMGMNSVKFDWIYITLYVLFIFVYCVVVFAKNEMDPAVPSQDARTHREAIFCDMVRHGAQRFAQFPAQSLEGTGPSTWEIYLMANPHQILGQLIGLSEKLQEHPIFHGKIYGFL